jgi:uncharacterized protein with PQ loop repeat
MLTVDILGWLAMVSSILYLCFGLPMQIIKNYKKKSTQGLSLMLIVFCAITLVMWSLYAWHSNPIDWYILGANLPGFFFSLVLLFQFWLYRSTD